MTASDKQLNEGFAGATTYLKPVAMKHMYAQGYSKAFKNMMLNAPTNSDFDQVRGDPPIVTLTRCEGAV